ncbi:unnamed protein product [Enterobius vermicularis]|uniref:Transmembrane protein 53 n=1 Tax=Enterobius vermicularis TaxID=51028 RepID=A0A0N4UZH8_ENTVE|nr:unnamed protein product [Enterobius vermicularis]
MEVKGKFNCTFRFVALNKNQLALCRLGGILLSSLGQNKFDLVSLSFKRILKLMFWPKLVRKCVTTKGTYLFSPHDPNTIVVLIGWAGARDNNIAKYSRLYETRGLTTLRYTIDIPFSALRGTRLSPFYTEPLMLEIDRIGKSGACEIILHLFSLNSLFVLKALMLSRPDLSQKMKGVVFDSCPATPKMSSFFFVLTMLLSQRFPLLPWYILGAMKYCFLGAAVCLELKEKLLNAVLQKRKDMDIYDWMRNRTDLPKHQLYIYSKADHLCSYRTIKEFCEDQVKRRQVTATQLTFEDSAHVRHLLEHPVAYESAINKFLDKLVFGKLQKFISS